MPKTITITESIIQEVQIAQVDGEYVMNVLSVDIDEDGNEYPRGWEPIKGDKLTTAIINRLSSVVADAKSKVEEVRTEREEKRTARNEIIR